MIRRMSKSALLLVLKSTGLFALTYLSVGAACYQLITKRFYLGGDPTQFSYLRTELDAASWAHTNAWIIPAVLLRGLLISVALTPFLTAMRSGSRLKVGLAIAGIVYLLGSLAAGAPSPSNIEGFVYMRPEYFSLESFLLTQPEMIIQALFFGFGLAWLSRSAPALS